MMKLVSKWALLLIIAVSCGCSDTKATVKGKVTYQQAPVTGYTLNLVWVEKGLASATNLDDQGAFTIKEPLDPGTYTAYLTPIPPEPSAPGSAPKKTVVSKIPPQCADPIKSTLKVTIKSGSNEIPLELKD